MTQRTQVRDEVRAVIGLGNPGPEYRDTYHNAGMLLLRSLAGDEASRPFKKYKGLFEYADVDGIFLVRTLTFMNDSGKAAKEALRVLKVPPQEMALAHDDSDLTIGDFKIVRGGGAAGHKGVISVADHLGTEDFLRIRIGIRPANETHRRKAGDFVLSPISKTDMETLRGVFGEIADEMRR